MTAQEMGEWLAWLEEEPCDPWSVPKLWGQLCALLANGPLQKKDKSLFKAADFLPEPWGLPDEDKPAAPKPSRRELAAKLRAMFKR